MDIEALKEKLKQLNVEQKVDLLSDIDVDWDGAIASILAQKMESDENIKNKVEEILGKIEDSGNNSENEEDKKEKRVIFFKLKEDEFSGKPIKKEESLIRNLDHYVDDYSTYRDLAVHEGNDVYEPKMPEDSIDENDFEENFYGEFNKGKIKGKKYWKDEED